MTLAETHNVSSAIALARQRGEGPSSRLAPGRRVRRVRRGQANRLLEESLGAAVGRANDRGGAARGGDRARRRGGRRSTPNTNSPGATPRVAVGAQARSPRRRRAGGRADLDASAPCELDALYAQSLELMLRRGGVRTLSLSTAVSRPVWPGRCRALVPARSCSRAAASRSTRSGGSYTRCARCPARRGLRLPRRGARHRGEHGPPLGQTPVAARDLLLAGSSEAGPSRSATRRARSGGQSAAAARPRHAAAARKPRPAS